MKQTQISNKSQDPNQYEGGGAEAEQTPVKRQRPKPGNIGIGIQKFKQDVADKEEIQSPFRLKKQQLSQLKLRDISADNQQEDKKYDFSEFDGRFSVVMQQLKHRQEQYETLKSLTTDQLYELYDIQDFKGLPNKWQKSLEMIFPPDPQFDKNLLVKFHQSKKADMDQIDVFLNEFNDWHQEKLHEFEERNKAELQNDNQSDVAPLLKMNTKDRTKLENINNSIVRTNVGGTGFGLKTGDVEAQITREQTHHMKGAGRQNESIIYDLVNNSLKETNIHPAIVRQYSTIASKTGQKTENDQLFEQLKKSAGASSTAEQRKEWQEQELELARQHSEKTGVPLDMGDPSKINKSNRWGKKKSDLSNSQVETESQGSDNTIYWVIAGLGAIAIGAALAIRSQRQNK